MREFKLDAGGTKKRKDLSEGDWFMDAEPYVADEERGPWIAVVNEYMEDKDPDRFYCVSPTTGEVSWQEGHDMVQPVDLLDTTLVPVKP